MFGSLSERIRSDLGAEEAAVYIDIGDGTLWLLPTGSDSDQGTDGEDEVFIQRGVGVVGLVALGAVPGAASKVSGAAGGGGGGSWGGERDGVDVLLLNDGLEAFDNGTTVEAALLRAARRRRRDQSSGGGGGRGDDSASAATTGTVRNMLLARCEEKILSVCRFLRRERCVYFSMSYFSEIRDDLLWCMRSTYIYAVQPRHEPRTRRQHDPDKSSCLVFLSSS